MSTKWVRFTHDNNTRYGMLNGEQVTACSGSPFDTYELSSEIFPVADVNLLAPCQPGKIVALWNNFQALAEKQGLEIPEAPYYFLKPSSCIIGTGEHILPPSSYDGRIFFKGELGVVIGRECKSIAEGSAADYILGYTCVNDVSAMQLIHEKDAYAQWTRAKSFDTFGAIGPCIASIDNPMSLEIHTHVNGRERQNYPVSDMIFTPHQLVELISADMTLHPGDIIACGTSLGSLPMKPGTSVEVSVDEIGVLSNLYDTP